MIVIVDYQAGNLASVERAVRGLGHDCRITRDHAEIQGADHVIFPGVGAAGAAMADLTESGLGKVLGEVYQRGIPFLGICLGTQIIFDHSDEDGGTACLGLVPGAVHRFASDMVEAGQRLKVPHMGWNRVRFVRDHPLLDGLDPDHEFYFVHSYYPVPTDSDLSLGRTDYGMTFTSVVARQNLVAVQFHLEKSGRPGLRILDNFCKWGGEDA